MDDGQDAPTRAEESRKKYSSINVASIADLKAELYKKQQEFRSERPKAPGTSAIQAKSASQKPSLWTKKNAGVQQRAAGDLAAKVEEEDSLVKSRRALEAKAVLYDKLAQSALEAKRSDGSSDGDDDDEGGEGHYLVDFARKLDDEWVDYVDSLGRSRRCLRRDLPGLISMDRSLSDAAAVSRAQPAEAWRRPASGGADDDDGGSGPPLAGCAAAAEPSLLSDDMRRELLRQKWEQEEQEAKERNRDIHYANVRFDEIRDHGAGFYEFSKDEAVRAEEMKKLLSIRQQTVHDRVHEEKIKQLRDEMLRVRLEAKRLQHLLKPGAASSWIPSDETRRKAEQQKIESLQQEIAGAPGDRLEQRVELKLRQEIAALRDAVLTPVGSGAAAKASPAAAVAGMAPECDVECSSIELPAGASGAQLEPSESDGSALTAAAAPASEATAAPGAAAEATLPEASTAALPPPHAPLPPAATAAAAARAARSDAVKRLQAAIQQLTKLQQGQLERLQRAKKRGPEEAFGLDPSLVTLGRDSASVAAASLSGGGDEDAFVGPPHRPAASAASKLTGASLREWDVGKPGLSTAAAAASRAKKSWKEQLRSERPEEFAPPASYADDRLPSAKSGRAATRSDEAPARLRQGATTGAAAAAEAAAEQLASDRWPVDGVGTPEPVAAAAASQCLGAGQSRGASVTGHVLPPPAEAAQHGGCHVEPRDGVQQPRLPPWPALHVGSSRPWSTGSSSGGGGAGGSFAAGEPPPPGVAVDWAAGGATTEHTFGYLPAATSQQQRQHHPLANADQHAAQWCDSSRLATGSSHFPQQLLAPTVYYDPSVPPPPLPLPLPLPLRLHQTAAVQQQQGTFCATSQPAAWPTGRLPAAAGFGAAPPLLPQALFAHPAAWSSDGAAAAAVAAPSLTAAAPTGGGGAMQTSVEAMLRSIRSSAEAQQQQ